MIISRETIKPSSPTPSHLHTYNLSEMDLLNPKAYIPMLLFYPNNRDSSLTAEQKAIALRKSLSHSLAEYYPFAGRLLTPTSSYVDCNDEGVLFLEARHDRQLDTFQRMSWRDEALDQLFPDDLVAFKNTSTRNLVAVQVNHFSCGGLGLAVSLSHTIGDGSTLGSFLSYWALVARYGSTDHKEVVPLNPYFIQSQRTQPEGPVFMENMMNLESNFVSRKFVFHNTKLSELKNKVASAAPGSVNNPTRVEVLTSLLYTTAVAAATTKTASFKPSYLFFTFNVREKIVPKLPRPTIGNFAKGVMVKSSHASEASLSRVVAEMRKKKLEVEGNQSVQQLAEYAKSLIVKLGNGELENVGKGSYWCTSLCGFPFNKVDFGWGKPTGTTFAVRPVDMNGFVMMDTADGDGIEVMMVLEKECMDVFENDKKMLSYCQIY